MELKANECRYGNFIIGTYESEDDNLVHETICEFKFYDCYNNYYNVESKERIEEFTGFKPIPLTEEWLLKFGFVKINRNFLLEFYNNGCFFYDLNKKEFWIGGYNSCASSQGFIVDNIEFVHQLQNIIFALTNKELEIKM